MIQTSFESKIVNALSKFGFRKEPLQRSIDEKIENDNSAKIRLRMGALRFPWLLLGCRQKQRIKALTTKGERGLPRKFHQRKSAEKKTTHYQVRVVPPVAPFFSCQFKMYVQPHILTPICTESKGPYTVLDALLMHPVKLPPFFCNGPFGLFPIITPRVLV